MPFTNKMKKILLTLALTLSVIGLLNATGFMQIGGVAEAVEGRGILERLFTTEERGMSFVQFEGSLAELTVEGYDEALVRTTDFRDFVLTVVNFALGFLGLFAVIIVIYGGVLYVASAGEEEKTQKGKKAITYATIGLLIVMGSFAFVNTIIRGAVGEGEEERRFISGTTMAAGFNATSERVSRNAREVYEKFVRLLEVDEELKSIEGNATRETLNYGEGEVVQAVPKSEVLSFLHNTKQRLLSIRRGFESFDETYRTINELIREIDRDIAEISAYPDVRVKVSEIAGGTWGVKVSDGSVETCSPMTEPVDQFVNCSPYPASLYPKWKDIRSKFVDDSYPRDEIMLPLKNEFNENVWDNLESLSIIHGELRALDVAIAGDVGTHYQATMREFTGRDDLPVPRGADTGSFLNMLAPTTSDMPPGLPEKLFRALENQLKYAEAINDLQAVEARLRANVTTGNAPLLVTFDVGGTVDPAGGTLVAGNIEWDLEGTRRLETDTPVDVMGAVECTAEPVLSADERERYREVLGATFRQCVFKHPGTYVASVRIRSNDPTRYVPGTSTLIIRVNPPTTLLDLEMRAGAQDPIPIMKYDERGLLILSRDNIPVTLTEARGGITFDASGTANVENFSWDFGNNQTVMTDIGGVQETEYTSKGRYRVELRVTNRVGEVDKKIFTLDVRDLAARITVSPTEDIFIGEEVRMDASRSAGENIRAYEWEIRRMGTEGRPDEKLELGAKASQRSFEHKFEEPGRYRIDLALTSDLESVRAEPYYITVSSRPPIAVFEDEIPRPTQPSTVHLDARGSFNPDGEVEDLIYEWRIRPDSDDGRNWIIANETTLSDMSPVIRFREKGEYEVTLKVTDSRTIGQGMRPQYAEVSRTINIDNILDVAWDEDHLTTAQLDEEGEAEMTFGLISENAVDYEIDFGDGESSAGLMGEVISHTYTSAGRYTVEAKVYDAEDNVNTISRRVYIGQSDSPLAKIGLAVSGVEIYDFSRPVTVSKVDNLRFDASLSRNVDGTGRNLNYSWDFGDTGRSSNRIAFHSYRELSPPDTGHYVVRLRVMDQTDPTKYDEDEIYINVVNLPPTFSSVQGVPEFRPIGALRTPVNVNVRAFGAEDPDGQITQYRWWYFDVNRPDDPLGMQITTSPNAVLKIGTKGLEGEEVTYGFGLEVTDNDNLTYSNEEDIMMGNYHTITVVNGPNIPPTASFTVDKTSVYVGDPINFTSTSTDPDGEIVRYYWDFDGDGFHNVEGTTRSNVSHVYKMKNMEGYNVRLKVVDDGGAEAVSDPITIYVDSRAEPPVAAFKTEPVEMEEDERGFKVQFINTSSVDEDAGAEIIDYRWDFDIDYDSTGDGITDNDIDSREENPVRTFPGQGNYRVKLTITDNQGNRSEVVQTVRVPLASPPVAEFTYTVRDGEVHFQNRSTSDIAAGAAIVRYNWDFDVDIATTEDSDLENPVYSYPASGKYRVRLEVRDSHGGTDSTIKEVDFQLPEVTPPDDVVAPPDDVTDPVVTPPPPSHQLRAVLRTTPPPAADGIVYLEGDKGTVKFDFSDSQGPISLYTFDKNIYFDSTGDGIPDNDVDYQTILPGRWTTNFEREWGRIGVKLTVRDIYGNKHSTVKEIKFK